MAFSLGSLFVELKANTAQFLDGMSKAGAAAGKTGKDIQKGLGQVGALLAPMGELGNQISSVLGEVGASAGQAFSSIGRVGGSLGMLTAGLGGASALGGALFALAEHAAEVGSKIFEASQKTGIAAGQLSGLMAVAKEAGGDFESLTTSLSRATVNLTKTAEEGGKLNPLLYSLMGGAKGAADLGLKPMGDRIQEVLQHIFALNDVGKRNDAISSLMGRGWMQNVEVLELLAHQGYGPAIAQAQKFGIYFDDAHAAQAKKFQVEINELKASFEGLGVAIGKKAVGPLTGFIAEISGLSAAWGEISKRFSSKTFLTSGGGLIGGGLVAIAHASDMMAAYRKGVEDFVQNTKQLVDGAKTTSDAEGGLSNKVKEHRDALAELVTREQDELDSLAINNNARREMTLEYDRTVSAIEKAVAAGGSEKEALQAKALALDILNRKLELYNEKMLEGAKIVVPKAPWLGPGWGNEPIAPPQLKTPALVPSELTPTFQDKTLSQLAQLPAMANSTRGAFRALREEIELSDDAFKRLAKAFPGLTESEVAATAAGRAMIEQLTRMDKVGDIGAAFKELADTLEDQSAAFGQHLVESLGHSIDQVEDRFAQLVVTGKTNFKELGRSIEESLVKAGLQKVVGMGLGAINNVFGTNIGGKPDGSRGRPFYVRLLDKLGNTPVEPATATSGPAIPTVNGLTDLITGVHDTGASDVIRGLAPTLSSLASTGADSSIPMVNGFTDLTGAVSSAGAGVSDVIRGLAPTLANIVSTAGNAGIPMINGLTDLSGVLGGGIDVSQFSGFGGFLADGGSVEPGHAYIVGEKHAEWFVPKVAGQVMPQMGMGPGARPIVYSPTYHITTPDADSFRRSHAQLVTEGYRAVANAHARSR